jgi:hypothetical protein
MKKLIYLAIIGILLLVFQGLAVAQSISITDISPVSPSSLKLNQKVSVNFDYAIKDASGVRIFIRPITSGKLTPNYAASGSPVYSRGKGTGSANFTITKGNVVVDQLRVQVLSANQNQLMFEFYVPVKFTFSSSILTVVRPKVIVKPLPQKLEVIAPADTLPDKFKEVKRTVTKDGIIEIHYADGSVRGIISDKREYRVDPATGDTTMVQKMFIEVPGSSQPADPPGLFASTTTEVDENWLLSLNAWIKYLGGQLLNSIEQQLGDEESFQNYKVFEQENSSTLYEQVNLRYTFLEKLLRLST